MARSAQLSTRCVVVFAVVASVVGVTSFPSLVFWIQASLVIHEQGVDDDIRRVRRVFMVFKKV